MINEKKLSNHYNPFAISALVFSALGLIILPILYHSMGFIFGLIALKQIKKTGEKGKWMALISIFLAIIYAILMMLGFILAVISNI